MLRCDNCGYTDHAWEFDEHCPICGSLAFGAAEVVSEGRYYHEECEEEAPTCGDCSGHQCGHGRHGGWCELWVKEAR